MCRRAVAFVERRTEPLHLRHIDLLHVRDVGDARLRERDVLRDGAADAEDRDLVDTRVRRALPTGRAAFHAAQDPIEVRVLDPAGRAGAADVT